MRLIKLSKPELNKLIALKHVMLPIEQSYLWQAFDDMTDDRTALGVYKIVNEKDTLISIAALTKYSQNGYEWVWIKHGPLFIDANPSKTTVTNALNAIKAFIASNEPNVVFFRVTAPESSLSTKSPLHHTMYDRTVIIDLTKSDEEILADMTRSGRYDVKRSLKSDIDYKKVPKQDALRNFHTYFKILSETAQRDGFTTNSEQVYRNLLDVLGDNIELYAAYSGKKPVAWAIVTNFAGKSVYYYGAGNELGRKLCAAYGLQYKIMQSLKEKGTVSYDMMGISSETAAPELATVTGFKTKFSRTTVDIYKTYDIPIKSARYATIKTAKKIKKLVRK